MNKRFITLLSFCLLFVVFFISCERYPVRTLLGLPDKMDSWPNPWYIYDDEINTKGSLAPYRWENDKYCADWDKVVLKFNCTIQPKNGRKCIQFTWKGNVNDPGKSYFGFGLMSTEYMGGVVNLSTSGYTNLKFWIRGDLYTNCSFEIKIPKTETTYWVRERLSDVDITPIWKEYSISLPDIEEMTDIEYDVAIALIADGITNGGTVYLDDIRFTKD